MRFPTIGVSFLSRIFRPHYSFVSHPAHNVKQGTKMGTWIATGPQPRVSLQPARRRWPHGWVLFRSRLIRGTTNFTAILYLDTDRGVEGGQAVNIPVPLKGTVNEVIYLPSGLKSLHWSPMGGTGSWEQAPVVMIEITTVERIARMVWRVLRMMERLRKENREIGGLSYSRLLLDLRKAYSTAGVVRNYVPKLVHGRWIERTTDRETVTLRIYSDAIIRTLEEVSGVLLKAEDVDAVSTPRDGSLLRQHLVPLLIDQYRHTYNSPIILQTRQNKGR